MYAARYHQPTCLRAGGEEQAEPARTQEVRRPGKEDPAVLAALVR